MLLEKIQHIHKRSHQTYGSPRIHAELQAQGHRVGCNRVARLIQEDGTRGRSADLYYANPGVAEHYAEIPNLKRQAVVTESNQVWVGNVTYLKLGRGWLYLAVVMDQYSRKVVGWALGKERTTELTLKALNQAVRARRPAAGTLFHSDRGAEYSAWAYRDRLASARFVQSMNRPRRMTDNAHMELFFHSMKSDVIHRIQFKYKSDHHRVVRSYMPHYNNVRRHSALNYHSSANLEMGLAGLSRYLLYWGKIRTSVPFNMKTASMRRAHN